MKNLLPIAFLLLLSNSAATASPTTVPKEIIKEICDSMKSRQFSIVLLILREEGFQLENVYDQLVCTRSLPTLMHFVIDEPAKYGMTIDAMIGYFDQKKRNDTAFDYAKILNITFTAVHDEVSYVTTVLDRINNRVPDLNPDSRKKLISFRKSLIKRGALTASELNSAIMKPLP
jgi:hypothetical protein